MNILIVEDEARIAKMTAERCQEILGVELTQIHICNELHDALQYIKDETIDLLLLDLNLNGEDGFELLQELVAESFHTIIISANEDKALKAFEFGVIDFLAKPYSKERLSQAFDRVKSIEKRSQYSTNFLSIKKHGRINMISIDKIKYLQASGRYTEVFLADSQKELHDKTLEKLYTLLPGHFERIHRSYIVNLHEIKGVHIHQGTKYELELQDGTILPIGRTRYKELKEKIDQR